MNTDEYALGWGTLTLINAGLAQGKGRSGLGWFLASILLGPLATLIIVVLPALEPSPSREPSAALLDAPRDAPIQG